MFDLLSVIAYLRYYGSAENSTGRTGWVGRDVPEVSTPPDAVPCQCHLPGDGAMRVMQNSPMKMIKKLSDLRTQAAGGAASEGFAISLHVSGPVQRPVRSRGQLRAFCPPGQHAAGMPPRGLLLLGDWLGQPGGRGSLAPEASADRTPYKINSWPLTEPCQCCASCIAAVRGPASPVIGSLSSPPGLWSGLSQTTVCDRPDQG
jgi:hypothetical protein